MEIATQIEDMARAAKAASPVVANASVEQRNAALLAIREALLFSGREEPEARTLEAGDTPDLISALQRLTLPSLPLIPPVSVLPSQKAMIWTEKEAVRKQVREGDENSQVK